MSEKIIETDNNCWIITNKHFKGDVDLLWFDDKYWLNQGRLLGANSGRGSAWMVKTEHGKMMLRHYYRGGIPAKFINDKYFWSGLNNTRSFCEFRLLAEMHKLNLPVPKPIAALVCKTGFFYQANILIEYISHKSIFAQFLNSQSERSLWENIGKTIAKFHKLGFYHADLNAHNILVADENIYLIDFDHSNQRRIKTSWQQANLKRLKRSIDKLTKSNYIEHNTHNWQVLYEVYNKSINE